MMNRNILHPMMFETPTPPGPIVDTGIYWSQSLGLISIGLNGNWITMADKNLGATQVWNSGDSSIAANIGNSFQRGNNYSFPSALPNYSGEIPGLNKSSSKPSLTNYGPYWYSEEFFVGNQWMEAPNTNLWGGVAGTVKAKRGPCAEGFHIPSKDEVQALLTGLSDFVGLDTTTENVMRYLKWVNYPVTYTARGERVNNLYGCDYWLADAYIDHFDSNMLYGNHFIMNTYNNSLSFGGVSSGAMLPIRPFKDDGEAPQANQGRQIIYDSGDGKYIQRNPDRGIISVPVSPTQFITIADKNLGATQVWNYGDVVTTANGGGMFQRGNCYMFPFEGDITTRTTTRKSVANYGPYYYSDTFITVQLNDSQRETSGNTNLRGGATNTVIARKGPCQEGRHVPSAEDWYTVFRFLGIEFSSGIYSSATISAEEGTAIRNALKMPSNGWIKNTGNNEYYGNVDAILLRTSDCSCGFTAMLGRRCTLCIQYQYAGNNQYGIPIRPFKNTPVVPDSTWTKLY